jgi:hypothetical protein
LTVTGNATITADPANDQPIINVFGGTLTIDPLTATQIRVNQLNLSSDATVSMTPAAGVPRVLVVDQGLSITDSSRLDLSSNALIVKGASFVDVQTLITSGFKGGLWDGIGINSSTAASDFDGLTTLGFLDNAELQASEFEGVTGLTGDEILVKFTYYGDADLSGVVNLDDFGQLLSGLDGASPTWLNGDFDYSGVINLDDFGQFLYGYDEQDEPL